MYTGKHNDSEFLLMGENTWQRRLQRGHVVLGQRVTLELTGTVSYSSWNADTAEGFTYPLWWRVELRKVKKVFEFPIHMVECSR